MRVVTSAMSKGELVLVTGATGRVGKEVVARLASMPDSECARRRAIRAEYAKNLGADETVTFDLEDKSTWEPALRGDETVLEHAG